MKLRIGLILLAFFLVGCGIPGNIPAVGPDGTIALFLDEAGAYDLYPVGGTLALLRNGDLQRLENVTITNTAGALSWSPDGQELLFVETETEESDWWDEPVSWTLYLTGIEPDSEPIVLLSSETLIFSPAFTQDGNITYLQASGATADLVLYDRSEGTQETLLYNVLGYLPATADRPFTVIKPVSAGALHLARLFFYDLETEEEQELALFLFHPDLAVTAQLYPGIRLWDVSPSGKWAALSLCTPALLSPAISDCVPSLYLIDLEENDGRMLGPGDIGFVFSPDEKFLAFSTGLPEIDETPILRLYDLEEKEYRSLPPQIEGSSLPLFWLDSTTLGLALASEETSESRLMAYDLETEDLTPLLPGSE